VRARVSPLIIATAVVGRKGPPSRDRDPAVGYIYIYLYAPCTRFFDSPNFSACYIILYDIILGMCVCVSEFEHDTAIVTTYVGDSPKVR